MTNCYNCKEEIDRSFGSGKFCSRPCANSRIRTQEIKDRVSQKLLGHISSRKMKEVSKKCVICEDFFSIRPTSHRKLCGKKECLSLWASITAKRLIKEGVRVNNWGGRCKKFTYVKKDGNKVKVDGSWELIFCRWADSQDLSFEKNRDGFEYIRPDGKTAHYYPDFKLGDGSYVEVKGYETDLDRAKWSQFPKKLSILRKKEILLLDSAIA